VLAQNPVIYKAVQKRLCKYRKCPFKNYDKEATSYCGDGKEYCIFADKAITYMKLRNPFKEEHLKNVITDVLSHWRELENYNDEGFSLRLSDMWISPMTWNERVQFYDNRGYTDIRETNNDHRDVVFGKDSRTKMVDSIKCKDGVPWWSREEFDRLVGLIDEAVKQIPPNPKPALQKRNQYIDMILGQFNNNMVKDDVDRKFFKIMSPLEILEIKKKLQSKNDECLVCLFDKFNEDNSKMHYFVHLLASEQIITPDEHERFFNSMVIKREDRKTKYELGHRNYT